MPINFYRHIYSPDNALITRLSPPDRLSGIVEGFYVFKTKDLRGKQLLFNDGYAVIALMQHISSNMLISVNGEMLKVGNAWVCGGLLRKIYYESPISSEEFFVIRFNPGAFFKIFNIDETTFKHKSIFDLVEIASYDVGAFNDAFYSKDSIEHKVEVVTSFLSRKVCADSFPNLLGELKNHIEHKKSLTVKELTQACGLRINYKWLERTFKKQVGITPKDYLLLRRFLNVYSSIDSLRSEALLKTALDHGYCDVNHLIKDFRSFAGQPPKAFFESVHAS